MISVVADLARIFGWSSWAAAKDPSSRYARVWMDLFAAALHLPSRVVFSFAERKNDPRV